MAEKLVVQTTEPTHYNAGLGLHVDFWRSRVWKDGRWEYSEHYVLACPHHRDP